MANMMTEYMILILRLCGRHFINVACVGLDADVANNISWIRKKKWIPVSQRYNASICILLLNINLKSKSTDRR